MQLKWACQSSLLSVNHARLLWDARMMLFLTPSEPVVGHPPLTFSAVERMADGWGCVVVLGSPGTEFLLVVACWGLCTGDRDFTKVPPCYCRLSLHQIQ